jgi:hypothetical protein
MSPSPQPKDLDKTGNPLLPKLDTATTPTQPRTRLSFFDALKEVSNGKFITKLEWNSIDFYGFMDEGRLRIMLADGKHDWIISEGDMIGEDWVTL